MDCIDKCRQGAIRYTRRKTNKAETQTNQPVVDKPDRRKFFTVSALLATSAALKAQEKVQLPDKKVDGGLAIIEDKKKPDRTTPITPPGSLSAANFSQHCTACQLCVSVCTNHVLRPSGNLQTFMQPEVSYERGYCRPECVKCSEVCPTGRSVQSRKRTCRNDSGKLHRQPGRRHLRQLCPPLPYPGDLDGGKRPERPGFASTAGHKRGKMHRLRSL